MDKKRVVVKFEKIDDELLVITPSIGIVKDEEFKFGILIIFIKWVIAFGVKR